MFRFWRCRPIEHHDFMAECCALLGQSGWRLYSRYYDFTKAYARGMTPQEAILDARNTVVL